MTPAAIDLHRAHRDALVALDKAQQRLTERLLDCGSAIELWAASVEVRNAELLAISLANALALDGEARP